MNIPFEPQVFGTSVNVHLLLEYLAFFIGFRYYLYLKRTKSDAITGKNRLSILLGAIVGAFIGSRFFAFLENPVFHFSSDHLIRILNAKTIMGGLFGGLIGVELAKKIIREKESSGDLFTLPLILGIFIGRIGCFLSGIREFTYGKPTSFFLGINLGDGIKRHPIALYELFFLAGLFWLLKYLWENKKLENGTLFKFFMIVYFSWRFAVEFLKPNTFFISGLSSIQWLCIICFLYYSKTLKKYVVYACQKIYLL